jgi:hypothetical protein
MLASPEACTAVQESLIGAQTIVRWSTRLSHGADATIGQASVHEHSQAKPRKHYVGALDEVKLALERLGYARTSAAVIGG